MGIGKGPRVHLPQEKCTSLPPKLDPQPLEKKFPLMGLGRKGDDGPPSPRQIHYSTHEFGPFAPGEKVFPDGSFGDEGPCLQDQYCQTVKHWVTLLVTHWVALLGYTLHYTLGYTCWLHFALLVIGCTLGYTLEVLPYRHTSFTC